MTKIQEFITAPKTIISKMKLLIKSEGLMGRSLRGGAILSLGNFVDTFLKFVRNMILTRVLAPEAFGLMATVIAAVTLIETLTEVGLRLSVIQNKRGAEEGFLNITWWVSALRGLMLYSIAFLATPLICQFFNKPDSTLELRIGFLVILLNGLISPRVHVLEKEMRFGKWLVIMQGAGITGILVGITSAFLLKNVWALIAGFVTEGILKVLLSFLFCPIKPGLAFDRECFREITKFSKGLFGLPILMILFSQTDVFVIGKVVSLELLGMYVLGKSIAGMPTTIVSQVVNPILLPAFSSMQDDKEKLRNVLIAVTRAVGSLGIPLIAFLILFSKSILSLAYGPQYGGIAVPFSILCLYSFLIACAAINMEMLYSIGKPNMHRKASLARAILFLSIIYPLTKSFGLTGASLSTVAAMSLALIIQVVYVGKILDIKLLVYFRAWMQGIKSALVFVIMPSLLFKIFFNYTAIQGIGFGAMVCLIALMNGVISLGLLNRKIIAAN